MSPVEQLVAEQEAKVEAANDLINRLATGEAVNAREQQLFGIVGWDDAEVKRRVDRLQQIRRLQAQAGTAAERAELPDQIIAANEAVKAARQRLKDAEKAVDEADTELRRAKTRYSQLRHQQTRIELAMKRLRDPYFMPDDVRAEIDALERSWTKDDEQQMRQLNATLEQLGKPLGWKLKGEYNIILHHCRCLGHEHPCYPKLRKGVEVVDQAMWDKRCEEIRAKMAEPERELSALSAKRTSINERVQALLGAMIPE